MRRRPPPESGEQRDINISRDAILGARSFHDSIYLQTNSRPKKPLRKEEQGIRNDAQTARRALREYPALFRGMEMAKRLQCNCAFPCIIQRATLLFKFARILAENDFSE